MVQFRELALPAPHTPSLLVEVDACDYPRPKGANHRTERELVILRLDRTRSEPFHIATPAGRALRDRALTNRVRGYTPPSRVSSASATTTTSKTAMRTITATDDRNSSSSIRSESACSKVDDASVSFKVVCTRLKLGRAPRRGRCGSAPTDEVLPGVNPVVRDRHVSSRDVGLQRTLRDLGRGRPVHTSERVVVRRRQRPLVRAHHVCHDQLEGRTTPRNADHDSVSRRSGRHRYRRAVHRFSARASDRDGHRLTPVVTGTFRRGR
jgi:hypothetical protein